MTIKKISAQMLEDMGFSDNEDDNEISQKELEVLYVKGMSEAMDLLSVYKCFITEVDKSALGEILSDFSLFKESLSLISFLLSQLIPKLLEGDKNGIMELMDDNNNITEDNIDELRLGVYQILKNKYL